MDFILSLTHFCEVHGPTSILCSQILPTPCQQCSPDSPVSSPDGSPSSPSSSSSIHVRDARHAPVTATAAPDLSSSPSSVRCVTTSAIEPLATPPASAPVTAPRIEDHPWFASEKNLKAAGGVSGVTGPEKKSAARLGGGGGADGDTCASCRLKLPEDVSRQLPLDANGSREDHGYHSSPVLRSREVVYACRGSHADHHYDQDDDYTCSSTPVSSSSHHHNSSSNGNGNNYYSPASVHSSYSSDSSCHTHVVTYLSMRGPANPDDYSLLRRASIRTLSCELLPRGLSSGPLSFGDSSAGYTVAYVFRLPDPMARGKRRSYALVALAGKDAGRTFKASPLIWRTFARIANNIVSAAEKFQEGEKVREHGYPAVPTTASTHAPSGRNYTPISSFLTGRALDPDGHPRRVGQVRARNLIEIVGNEYIFAELHAQFVALLQQLSAMFISPSDSHHADMYDDYTGRSSSDRLRGTGSTGSDRSSIDHDRSATAIGAASFAKQFSQLQMSTSVPKPIPISRRRKMVA
ncbi:hypothetical protein McanMca71_000726 [Microsporum canis]|uniref:UDENN FLCN/SMCR8-type domain-containing protein n=1 Tax=Arthroderma otae (strain ATCC MYA-4605 / CBS 113480) TaxID=554155 RepID=C5FLJ9_ARTOC|nr:conserved hypothetical protein [Microsporum canis CBS 113480]EEQ30571.1 conserved hypothetical protein [Microsporum canis CBS 113480]